MPVINTNLLSAVTQTNLYKSKNSLSSAIERLGSGLRINSAKDDAAGQGIANRLTTNIRGFTQVKRNVSDGISIAQTTEGALNEVNNNTQRIRELTVQAKNESNSQRDLNSIQAEIRLRLDEIDRISSETQFNGKKVLKENSQLVLQTGVNDHETINLKTKVMPTEQLGIHYFNVNALEQTRPINQMDANALTNNSGLAFDSLSISTIAKNTKINQFTSTYGFTSGALDSDGHLYRGSDGSFYMKIGVTQPIVPPNDVHFKNLRMPTNTEPEIFFFAHVTADDYLGNGEFDIKAFDATSLMLGKTTLPPIIIAPNNGQNILDKNAISNQIPKSLLETKFPDANFSMTADPEIMQYYYAVPAGESSLRVGNLPANVLNPYPNPNVRIVNDHFYLEFDASSAGQLLDFYPGQKVYWDITDRINQPNMVRFSGAQSQLVVSSLFGQGDSSELYVLSEDAIKFAGAEGGSARTDMPLALLDKSINQVDTYRGELGAIMNRLESVLDNATTAKINFEAARSRIEDADYAVEISLMSRNQILQQAGMSVLLQANQTPQIALQLLK